MTYHYIKRYLDVILIVRVMLNLYEEKTFVFENFADLP